ncbi:MAG: YneF family protein [Culicoidibacterales bacterium]
MELFWTQVLLVIFGLLVGLVAGYFAARYFIQKELEKNPPLNEVVIAEMMSQMGRKPSKKQVQAVMKASQQQTTKK